MTRVHIVRYTMAGLLSAAIGTAAGVPAAGVTAELRYLQHSGWLVQTASHVLVFDYVEAIPGGTPTSRRAPSARSSWATASGRCPPSHLALAR